MREGLAQLVADLGNSKRVQEPEQMDVETYLALRDEDRPEYPITDDERAWLDMRPVGNEEL